MKLPKFLWLFDVAGYVYQVYFLLMCTIWRGIVVIPNGFFRPPLSDGYWWWYLERPYAVPYERVVIGVDSIVGMMLRLIILLGILQTLGNKEYREMLGKKRIGVICGIGGVLCAAAFLYGKLFGEPFYLVLGVLPFEFLSLMMLVLLISLRRAVKRQEGGPAAS